MGLTFMDINNAIFFWKIKYEKYALNDFLGDQIRWITTNPSSYGMKFTVMKFPKKVFVYLIPHCFKFPKTFRPYGVVSQFLMAIGQNI